ncbi:hypothetical protein [uncultured Draconibacterium sp.]|uniref:hypothetical protein n=1 Tax=uncultured Draconibacterium sp. TaxID=1573823 RepID=UPI002AA92D84|nr:hypothetical protein [uncultured Draconibacterium sp.]
MDIYKLLQNNIQSKINKSKLYGSDCNLLSQKIYDETRRQVSSSTIKRFFGLIRCNFKPSKYTLDTLSEFVGFKDWNDFKTCNNHSNPLNTNVRSWDLLKERMMLVTMNSLELLKQKTNYKKQQTIFRQQERQRFEKFEASSLPATLFIAPNGYGKSTLMIQLLEKYFLIKNGKYENDIVCLIDGEIFFKLFSRNSHIDILNQLLEFNIHSDHNFYFQKHPEKRKGRLWLIIDDVDDVFIEQKGYSEFVENIMQIMMINEDGWFKVILTCKPNNLDVFNRVFHRKPFLKSLWFDVRFSSENFIDSINIPLLSKSEIKTLLKLHHNKNELTDIFTRYKDLLEITFNPHLLSLFIDNLRQNDNISEVLLLNHLIMAEIFSPPFLEEKMYLIKRYVILCKRGQESNWVEKNQLLSNSSFEPAYNQLLSDGIIYENFKPTNSIDLRLMVNFTQKTILEYIIFRSWIKNKNCSTDLFFEIAEYYKNNQLMECSMVTFFLKMTIFNKKFDIIKDIQDKLLKIAIHDKNENTNLSVCMRTFSSVLKVLMENNNELKNYFNN